MLPLPSFLSQQLLPVSWCRLHVEIRYGKVIALYPSYALWLAEPLEIKESRHNLHIL